MRPRPLSPRPARALSSALDIGTGWTPFWHWLYFGVRRIDLTASRSLVIAKLDERSGFPIESAGPIRIVERGLQDDRTEIVEAASIPEAAPVRDAQQPWKRIVRRASFPFALIDDVDDQSDRASSPNGMWLRLRAEPGSAFPETDPGFSSWRPKLDRPPQDFNAGDRVQEGIHPIATGDHAATVEHAVVLSPTPARRTAFAVHYVVARGLHQRDRLPSDESFDIPSVRNRSLITRMSKAIQLGMNCLRFFSNPAVSSPG
jgi:hypothetical protein